MNVGLTLGKFAPLHRGHQLLIETALAEVDHLIVIIYHSEETAVPLARRAGWIRSLYPSVEIIESPDGPTTVGYTPEIIRMHDDYLRALVGDRGITHFYSSEPYGDHVSRALGAADRRVDTERAKVPVSATAIRANPFAHRAFLHPLVYRDLVTHVVFVGAPSTGKTTLAEEMARRYATVCMPEYGREYWERSNVERRLTREQLVEIALEHRAREDALCVEANRFMFIDTDATTTRLFSRYYHGECDPRLDALADEAAARYDVVFLCDDDIPYDDTADRSGAANRTRMQKWVREDLARRGVAYITLRGTVEQRARRVTETLASFEKFGSAANSTSRTSS